ncbi:DUF1294 domain-containing protein [Aurantiacibacter marinus]|uniref:Cold-shock protein n=1 Tax=Aurantiacibacter marinus TaxID=874156 RepID=A0A0H0XRS0_9SPHN|nr:DUF1294 domain-containing protein [Aurantiacibacter marinus]KLI65039.1 cold-shock protein [Aurantiacibacter marinus]
MIDHILVFAVLINILAFASLWYDKAQAVAGGRRIPEVHLLGMALFGGTPGAFLGRHLFRHKTRKQPFSIILQVILVLQIGVIIGLFLVPM